MVDVIILAGGTVEEEDLRREVGVNCKSLIPFGDQVMLAYVLQAMRGARGVGRIVVIGPEALASHPAAALADQVLPEGGTRAENLFRGIDALPDAERILMATTDTPLITSAMIDELLAEAPECDVCYPVVPREVVMESFSERTWIFVSLRDGAFTGSSMVLFRPPAFRQIRPLLEQVIGAHREHWKVARMFGWMFLLRCRFGWITVPEIEARVSRIVGLQCRGYKARHAELAFDVDHLDDLPIARVRLEEGGKRSDFLKT